MAFSWLKAATTAFTFKTLLRHYASRGLLSDYEPSDGPFWSITNDPGLRLTQCSYKIDEDSPSNIFPAQFVSYAVCGVITDLISYALTQQYKTKHNKPRTICTQQKMIDKNLIFSPAKFIVPIFDLSNHLDFLTYRLIHWLSVMLQTINRRSCTITEKVLTWTVSWLGSSYYRLHI